MQRSLLSSLRSSISPYPTKEGFVAKRSSAADKTLPAPLPLFSQPPPSPAYSYSLCKAFSPLRGPARVYAFASSIDVMLFLPPAIFMLMHKHSFECFFFFHALYDTRREISFRLLLPISSNSKQIYQCCAIHDQGSSRIGLQLTQETIGTGSKETGKRMRRNISVSKYQFETGTGV